MLLAPRGRKAYFDKNWGDKTFGKAKDKMIKKVHEYWKKHYAQDSVCIEKLCATTDDDDRSPLDMQIGDVSQQLNTHDDAFLNYIHSSITGNVDVLSW